MPKSIIDINVHRGNAALDTSEIQRELFNIEDEQRVLKARQEALEIQLTASPSINFGEALERARYLIALLSQSTAGRDPRRKKLIANTLEDLRRLNTETATKKV